MKLERNDSGFSVRIPDDVVAALGLVEGDEVDLCAAGHGQAGTITDRQRRLATLARLSNLAVAFPTDYKFDREGANAR